MSKPWPLNISHELSPEDQAYYERLADLAERGLLELRDPTEEEEALHREILASPVTVSIERRTENEFSIHMYCRCGAQQDFDHTAPQPWSQLRDNFEHAHEDCHETRT